MINLSAINNDHIMKSIRTHQNENITYYEQFVELLNDFEKVLSSKDFDSLITKFQLFSDTFHYKSYIQIAVESTIVHYYMLLSRDSFRYEPELNSENNKKVECQICINDFKFNIEVKTAEYNKKEEIDRTDGFKIIADGRYENYQEISDLLKKVLTESQEAKGEQPKPTLDTRRMDNNLKTFLIEAHNKFPNTDQFNNLNCLFIGCDNEDDLQCWFDYLYSHAGFFTKTSYINHSEFSKVDLIVLTNQYYQHNKHLNSKAWDFSQGLNFIFQNPFAALHKPKLIDLFITITPSKTIDFNNYRPPSDKKAFYDLRKLKFYIVEEIYRKVAMNSKNDCV